MNPLLVHLGSWQDLGLHQQELSGPPESLGRDWLSNRPENYQEQSPGPPAQWALELSLIHI